MKLLLLLLNSCSLYEYSPTVKLQQVVVGASNGELYLTSDLICGLNPKYQYSIGSQITRCKYFTSTEELICKNIANNKSIISGLNTNNNEAFLVDNSYELTCKTLWFNLDELSEEESGWTKTE